MDSEDPCMPDPSSQPPPASTFILRFWQEWVASGLRWRGRIEHVQSGKNTAFLTLDEMLIFLHRFGVMESKESPPGKENPK